MAPPPLRIRVGDQERTFDGTKEVVVGRAEDADVTISHPRVSRQHLLIRPDGEAWLLEDASSKNGTWRQRAQVRRLRLATSMTLVLGLVDDGQEVEFAPADGRQGDRDGRRPRGPDRRPVPADALGAPSSVYRPAGGVVRIGRASDNDIVIPDLEVSRHHAELRPLSADRFEVVDMGSKHGTFVDGQRARRAEVADGSLIGIGHHLLRVTDGQLEDYVDTGAVTFDAVGLTVLVGEGHVLLDDVSFALEPNSVLAIVGPSGAGKSTLVRALTGFRPADEGTVFYNGRAFYGALGELRSRIGYVPQDDILHEQLTPRQALDYAAELRFPSGVTPTERSERTEEVLRELGIDQRASVPIRHLSGGQRKRTNVALELLTRPSVLFLDEPTSGLDPGFERAVMQVLRELADGGRTVILTTHSVQSLDLCDRVMFLAPGGRLAYFGPPDEALAYFQRQHYSEVFTDLERSDVDWGDRFHQSPAHTRYVERPLAQRRRMGDGGSGIVDEPAATIPWVHQFKTLVRRYLAVITADRRQVGLLLGLAPAIGLIVLLMFDTDRLAQPDDPASVQQGVFVLFMLVFAATFMGALNAVREIVKELPVYRRERAVGLSISAYLASKVAVLGLLVVVQAVLVVLVGTARQGGPITSVVLGPPKLELIVVVALAGLAAMAAMLLVSALVDSADKAMPFLILFLIPQLAFAGVFPIPDTPGVAQAGYVTSASWATAAAASTAHVRQAADVIGCEDLVALRDELDAAGESGLYGLVGGEFAERLCAPAWRPDANTWLLNTAMLLVLTAVALGGAYGALRRRDPKPQTHSGV